MEFEALIKLNCNKYHKAPSKVYLGFDLFCPVSIFQCVVGVLVTETRRADVGDHNRTTVTSEGVFE